MTAVSAAPESSTEVLAHPNKIEAEDWAAVKGILPGNLTMVTLAPWEDGRIAEEYLFRNKPTATISSDRLVERKRGNNICNGTV
jgi:hypothetical protein